MLWRLGTFMLMLVRELKQHTAARRPPPAARRHELNTRGRIPACKHEIVRASASSSAASLHSLVCASALLRRLGLIGRYTCPFMSGSAVLLEDILNRSNLPFLRSLILFRAGSLLLIEKGTDRNVVTSILQFSNGKVALVLDHTPVFDHCGIFNHPLGLDLSS